MDTESFLLIIFKLLCVFVLIFFNAFFVCGEFAFVKARKTRMEELEDKGVPKARDVLFGIEHLDMYLSVCQLGVTLSSLGLGWLGEPAISSLIRPLLSFCGIGETAIKSISVIVGFIIITFLHVVFGELAPKNMAMQKAEKMVLSMAPAMKFFYHIFYPFVILLNSMASVVTKMLKIKPATKKELTLSSEELKLIVEDSQEGGHIEEHEEEIIQNVLDFDEKTVKDVMTPWPDVATLEENQTLEEIIPLTEKGKYSRYPVLDSEDRIMGILHLKDAFFADRKAKCGELITEALFVPEIMSVEKLLDKFRTSHRQIGIAIDEYGIYAGIVTMEDVLEELVGEIQDEFNNETENIVFQNGIYSISGKTDIDEMCEKLAIDYNREEQDISTAAGFVIDILGVIPKNGDTFEYGKYRWTVSDMDGQRILNIKAEKKEEK